MKKYIVLGVVAFFAYKFYALYRDNSTVSQSPGSAWL